MGELPTGSIHYCIMWFSTESIGFKPSDRDKRESRLASEQLKGLQDALHTAQKRLNWCEAELPVRQNRIEELETQLRRYTGDRR